ncbi:MAG: single-stranded DNA-binding protein [Methylococcales bacterium]|nr:single-stranded DNA-binding protein [Methylococcales bacterium]
MLKVVIEPAQATQSAISNRSGTSASGRPWQIRSQECWIYSPNSSFPRLYAINLPDDIPLYPAGEYLLDVESMIQPNDFKGLSLSRGAAVLVTAPVESAANDDAKKSSLKFGS